MTTPTHLIVQWLARPHPTPRHAIAEWESDGIAMLPLGVTMSAIRLTGDLVHAAVDTDDCEAVAGALEACLNGAVIRDRSSAVGVTYYALIQQHAGLVWDLEETAPCLGDGVYLGVPALHRVQPPGAHWAVPPHYEGDLCRPQSVRELVAAGLQRLMPAECP
ncbi:hypothetical protein ACIQI8_27650 [Streptomyces sp. NPDC092369]|uniref:hypothetical protein n=1 Tax=Streptomyces sp. NPDC092369 TaxID=3366015 RepID=UPI00382B3827